MRFINNQTSAANRTCPMPFAGLGFDTECIQAAAQTMTPRRCSLNSMEHCLSGLDSYSTWQPCGYELLVTLGREIRGR